MCGGTVVSQLPPPVLVGSERELVNAIVGLLVAHEEHDVDYARAVLQALARTKGFCMHCGQRAQFGTLIHAELCIVR